MSGKTTLDHVTDVSHWLTLAKQSNIVPGYLPGFVQPALVLAGILGPTAPCASEIQRFYKALADLKVSLPEPIEVERHDYAAGLRVLLVSHATLANELGFVMAKPGSWTGSQQPGARIQIFLPCNALHRIGINNLFRVLAELMAQCRVHAQPDLSPIRAFIDRRRADKKEPKNVQHFVREALQLGFPVLDLPLGFIQVGQGARGIWLNSSFTEECSVITANLCRSKPATAEILRIGGVPVPDHAIAETADKAVTIASQLGYPVVLKPTSLDGGAGVQSGLESEDEIRSIFPVVAAYNVPVLVERHVEGRDYRLVIFRDRLIAAIERIPGGVVGDGRSTIAELVTLRNAERLDGPTRLELLDLDEEALDLLRRAGRTLDYVPSKGEAIRLRRASNFARGGTARGVRDEVHPDNRDLAIRATHLLRLDLSGIDLIIPDIRTSWRESGAAIIEVNGQPHLGEPKPLNLFKLVLEELIPTGGRIPVVAIVGSANPKVLIQDMATAAGENTKRIGFISGAPSLCDAGRKFNIDRDIGAVLVTINDDAVLREGFPFDKIDLLVLAGETIVDRDGSPTQKSTTVAQVTAFLSSFGRPVVWAIQGAKAVNLHPTTRRVMLPALAQEIWSWLRQRM